MDFLYKPIDPEVLRFKVSVFASLQRQADLLKKYSTQLQDANAALEQRVDSAAELRASMEELRQFAYVASRSQRSLRTITTFAELLSQRYKGRLAKPLTNSFTILSKALGEWTVFDDLLVYSTHE